MKNGKAILIIALYLLTMVSICPLMADPGGLTGGLVAIWKLENGTTATTPYNVSMGSTRVETVTPLGGALSGTVSIDVGASDWYYGTIAGATTIEFTGWSDSGHGDWCMVELVNPGASALTVTDVQWPGGDTPDWTAAGTDVFTVRSRTGGLTIDGQVIGYDYD